MCNNFLTYWSSGDPCLDFFFQVVPETPADTIELLEKAWHHNPLTTLKLIFNLRGIQGTGKANKKGFFTCALWLYDHYPYTLALNLDHLPHFGSWFDCLKARISQRRVWMGGDLKKKNKKGKRRAILFSNRRLIKQNKYCYLPLDDDSDYDYDYSDEEESEERRKMRAEKRKAMKKMIKEESIRVVREKRSKVPWEQRIRANLEEVEQQRDNTRKQRKQRVDEKAKRALEKYDQEPKYSLLYDKICELFAQYLRSDLKWLSSGKLSKIGLASKWCPSIDSAFDKTTVICECIARRVFLEKSTLDAHYAYRVRERLRKQVIAPLDRALELPEIYTGANQWGSLPYNRNLFRIHHHKRFFNYLEDVEKGKATIATEALLPPKIIASLDEGMSEEAELQWKTMVEGLKKKGKLDCIAVCDASIEGTPAKVCLALGLLISELSKEPWKGKAITTSEDPGFHMIKGDDLKSKTEFIRTMKYGDYYIDFQKVFDLISKVAVDGRLDQDQIFDDGESQHAEGCTRRGWETKYEKIVRTFKENGFYQVPEIVFWSLGFSEAIPVTYNGRGVVMLSGYSKNLVELFLDRGGPSFRPLEAMELAIASEVVPITQQADDEDDSFSDDELFDDLIETGLAMHAKLDGIMDQKGKRKTSGQVA
ncbi:LOW QUALITY PROTEIN: hypothetical protein Cgig2_004044 [Carnegiea gigantea]|uniref:Uncharacterized protein n=1 Tax=Carnegiea gigantea TaxID=171969 RepID=A0A9Q1KU62_9CARY|nr:LOW QUALITY PROTEIN: hypothetical protein Cgig2_004044 [Carnegiea gigantea]